MTLSTGTTIDGTVLVNGPVGQQRLSDYVRTAKPFLVRAHLRRYRDREFHSHR